jgi:uncharacterized protein YjbI with pentapeptide repeats
VSDEERAEATQSDENGPTPERQAELRAAYEANVVAGKAPYAGVRIRTPGELRWIMQERRWSVALPLQKADQRAKLSGADLADSDLSGAVLNSADLSGTDLDRANLGGAHLSGANLSGAHLFGVNLRMATLADSDLSGAVLRFANLSEADLYGANLSRADLWSADLSGAILRNARMDATTVLLDARLNDHTLLADVVWNGAPLTRLNWQDVSVVGEERVARQPTRDGKRKGSTTRLLDYADAVLASRQVATVLRSQGLNEHADRFAYNAQVLQRQVLFRQGQFGRFLGSALLDALAGYGYKPVRSLLLYLAMIVGFATTYYLLGPSAHLPLSPLEAVVFSVTSFHGRGFAPGANVALSNPLTVLAAAEAVLGLLVEITFIATFTQRFFAR